MSVFRPFCLMYDGPSWRFLFILAVFGVQDVRTCQSIERLLANVVFSS